MMRLFTNNASTTLASPISNVALSMTVATGDGAKYPNPTGGDYFMATLYRIAAGEELDIEIVKCTARSGDVLTIQRGQEGTTAVAHSSGDLVGLRVTAAAMNEHENLIQNNKDVSGGIAGLTLLKINFLNALGTFVSFFTNANTAARTYTFQDRDGTIADNTDLALKADKAGASFTGVSSVTVNSTSAALTVTQTGTGNAFVVEDAASDTTPFVIDASGKILQGLASSYGVVGLSNNGYQITGTTIGDGSIQQATFISTGDGPRHTFITSRGTTAGTHGVLLSGDTLGELRFAGSDGTAFIRGASIIASVDGTPGTNDMPTRLVFSTTPDGSSAPVERVRIANDGQVIGTDNVMSRFMMKDTGHVFVDKGNSSTTTQTLDFTAGGHQKVTATGNHTFAFSNWPPTGNTGFILFEATNYGAYTITPPTVNWIKPDGTTTTNFATYLAAIAAVGGRASLQASGTDFMLFWSRDAGTTVYGKLI